MRLKDKIAIITGGSRGIGLATADAFLREGAVVIITASSPATAEKAVKELAQKYPYSVIEGISPDLSSLEAVREAFAGILGRYGRVDILSNLSRTFFKFFKILLCCRCAPSDCFSSHNFLSLTSIIQFVKNFFLFFEFSLFS